MKVVSFVTLFLGLVMGQLPVRLEVSQEVASVEVLLDGRRVTVLRGPPWEVACDLGSRLEPHRLVAVASDASGEVLGSVTQWINLPRSLAEADFVVEPHDDGVTVQVTWRSVTAAEPESVVATLDGDALPTPQFPTIQLPPLPDDGIHYLRAELGFPGGVGAVAEAFLQGERFGGRTDVRLTSVPIAIERRSRVPKVEDMEGMWSVEGSPVRVSAVEHGPADIIMVVSDGATNELREQLWDGRYKARLRQDQSLRLMLPRPEKVKTGDWHTTVFRPTQEFFTDDGTLLTLMSRVYMPSEDAVPHQQLWDAVAVAGRLAASRGRRRAVVLVLGAEDEDDRSHFTPEQVGHYLSSMHVPLVVWSPFDASARGPWGRAAPILSHDRFDEAAHKLSRLLDRQAMVWLEGLYLPQTVELSPQADGFQLLDTVPDADDMLEPEANLPIPDEQPTSSVFDDLPPRSDRELDRIRSLLAAIPEGCPPNCREAMDLFHVLGWSPEGSDIRYLAYVNDHDEFEISRGLLVATDSVAPRAGLRKFCVVVFSEKEFQLDVRLTPAGSAQGRGGTVWGETTTRMHPLGGKDVDDQLWIGAAVLDNPPNPSVAVEIEAIDAAADSR